MELTLEKIALRYGKDNHNRSSKAPLSLYLQLFNLLRDMIVKRDLPENYALPPSRQLAIRLGVSRSTIIRAYEFLRLEGFVESKQGSGHSIKPLQKKVVSQPLGTDSNYPEISKLGKSFLNNASLINTTDDKSVAFRPGLPPLDIFPVAQWKNLSNLYWKNIKLSNLSYSPASGIDQLKINIANYLTLSRGIKCEANQVLIMSGSLQSLYLIGAALINPGDSVAMENPTFPNVHSIFRGLMGQVHGIGLDKEGMSLDRLENLNVKPKIIHTTPSCHYPTGVQMTLKRRLELLAFANKNESIIIENDYEHELNNWDNPIPSLFSLYNQYRTIYLGTFNRLLHPSLRIGYMIVPRYLREVTDAILKHSHRFVPTSIQVVLNQFMEKKYLYAHIKNVVDVTKKRQHFFTQMFEELFKDSEFRLQSSSVLSLQNLITVPKDSVDKDWVNLLGRHNIIVHSYNKCFTDSIGEQGLILGYSSIPTAIIKNKLNQMNQIMRKGK